MTFERVLPTLTGALEAPLPGPAAQDRMAPRPRREWPAGFNPARIRQAAGLLLVFPRQQIAHVVLTVRADTVRHGGQVSMPGGVVEPGETLEQAALREAHEEVGLASRDVSTLGALTPLDIPVSGFRLYPIVAAAASRPDLTPSDSEVARIIDVSLAELVNPRALLWRTMERDGRRYDVPVFQAEGAEIWGATAMALAELLTILGWTGPPR